MKIAAKKLNNTEIPFLSSMDQYIQTAPVILGMDTEMLWLGKDGVPIWPHEAGFPQERKIELGQTADATREFDFHGDGFAHELCVEPTYCLERMMNKAGYAFSWMQSRLHDKGNVKFAAPAVYEVPEKVSKAAPDEVKRLGCMPSINVYGDKGNPSVLGENLRTTGCHLHMSHKTLTNATNSDLAENLVKWADIIVGTVWTYISPVPPKDEKLRRKAYGRAGECRIRDYPPSREATYTSKGVEYRVLPGTVLINPIYMTLVFNLYRSALRFALVVHTPPEEVSDMAREAINEADKNLANDILTWLPFSADSKKVLDILHEKPVKLLSPAQWYEASRGTGIGHRAFAYNHNRDVDRD